MKKRIAIFCLIVLFFNISSHPIQVLAEEIKKNNIEQNSNNEKKDILSINEKTKDIVLGGKSEINYTYESDEYSKDDLIWTSSNEKVVQVKSGQLEGYKTGSASIKVESKDKKLKAECKVNVVRNLDKNKSLKTSVDEVKYPLTSGITYEVNNTTSDYIYIKMHQSTYTYYNIISYNSDNSIDYVRVDDSGYVYLAPGKRVVLSWSKGGDSESYISIETPYVGLLKTKSTPVFQEYEISSGKTYEITSTNDMESMIVYPGYSYNLQYEYASYKLDGSLYSSSVSDYGYIYPKKDYRKQIRLEGEENTTFYIPYEHKGIIGIKELNTPVFKTYEIQSEQTYEITNSEDISSTIIYPGYIYNLRYDYVSYKLDGDLYNSNISDYGYIYPNKNYREQIRLEKGYNTTFYIPYEHKDIVGIKELNTPVFETYEGKSEQTYEITNSKDISSTIIYPGYIYNLRYDYVSYKLDGSLDNANISDYGYIYPNKNYRRQIRLERGYNTTFYIPYEHKDIVGIKELDTPIFTTYEGKSEQTYEITSGEDIRTTIMYPGYVHNMRYDYASYKLNGDIDSVYVSDYGYISPDKNYRKQIRLERGYNTTFYIPYEHEDIVGIKELDTPVFYKVNLKQGENYRFENSTDLTSIILGENGSNNKYGITIYRNDGSIRYSTDDDYGSNKVYSGESAVVSVLNNYSMNFYMPFEHASGELDKFFIKEVNVSSGGINKNVLSSVLSIERNSSKIYNIKVNAIWDDKKANKIVLRQGTKEYESKTGEFNLALGTIFNSYDDIYAIAIAEDYSRSRAAKLNINMINQSSLNNNSLTLGAIPMATAPENTPMIGGMNFDLNLGAVKIAYNLDPNTGILKIVLGAGSNLNEQQFNSLYDQAKAACDISKIMGESIRFNLGKSFSAKTSVTGYMKCKVEGSKRTVLDGGIVLGGSLDAGITQHIGTPIGPVYIGVGAGADIKLDLNISSKSDIESGILDFTGSKIMLAPKVTAKGGYGLEKFISVGPNGYLSLNMDNDFVSDAKLKIKGGFGIKVKALVFEWGIDFTPFTYPKGKSLEEDIDIYNLDDYTLMSREYIAEESAWMNENARVLSNISSRSNEDTTILQSGVYSNTEPKIAIVNNKKVLIWLRDNKERSSINRTELVYSIYDENKNTWATPKSISDDKTADFYPQVAYDDDNLFVVWQNVSKVLNDSASITDVAKESEIVVSKFNTNTNTFENPIKVSNSNTYDGMPIISTNNGKAHVAWINNNKNDIFGKEGTNNIIQSSFNGSSWSGANVLVSNAGSIKSMDSIYNGDDISIVYSKDMDANSETIDDHELFSVKAGNKIVKRITNNDVIDSNPQLVKGEGEPGIIWFSNEELLYSKSIDNINGENLFSNSVYSGSDNFNVINTGDNFAILWTDTKEDKSEVYGAIYNKLNKTINDPIKLTNTNQMVKSVDGIFEDNGDLTLASNIAEILEREIEEVPYYEEGLSSLAITTIKSMQDISVDEKSIFIDDRKFGIGEELPVSFTIKNEGQLPIEDVLVEFYEGNEKLINSNEVEISLQPGESKDIQTTYIPKEAKKQDVKLKVMPLNGEDSFVDNNMAEFSTGFTDVFIKELTTKVIENKSKLSVLIANETDIESGEMVLNIKEDSKDGNVIYTKNLDGLSGKSEMLEIAGFDFNSLTYNDEGKKTLYVEIETESEEKYKNNNYEHITITRTFANEDINKDGKIDILDLATAGVRYNTSASEEDWDYKYDINLDGIIDIYDLVRLSRKFE